MIRQEEIRRFGLIALGLGLSIVLSGGWVHCLEASPESRRSAIVDAVEKVRRSVVSITSEKKAASPSRWPFSPEENQRPRVNGMGSGVIVDARGYILTNHHVVDKVQGIVVQTADGTTYPARLLQYDPVLDLAVVKVEPVRALVPVVIGTSSDLMVGETVLTVGNAFGYENTVSVGIISALHRDVTLSDDQVYRNLIQTDACINPGNSGGPLINIDGELIGINVAVRAGAQGIGFALPIDEIKGVAAEMLSTRRLSSTWHGLVAAEQRNGTKRIVVVAEVLQGSPAASAGFKVGDELVRVGEIPVTNVLDLERGFIDVRPGQRASLTIRRGGTDSSLALDLKPLPELGGQLALSPDDLLWKFLGLKTMPVNNEYVSTVSSKLRGGLYVQAVLPGSPAAEASIQRGDILVGMNVGAKHWETIRADNILYVLRQPEAAQTQSALLYVVRRNGIQPRRITLGDALVQAILNR
jgi:serine protease Do